ncbi:MAG: hypothetical protein LUF26_08685 [Firmicutes bacterium]|nr:hypothetical protein [Bacillota bacterium]
MKKFTKLFLSCAAVAAVTAAVATSAMAADTLSASYSVDENGTTGTLTIDCASTDETKTLLVLAPGADITSVTADQIVQIDQDSEIKTAVLPAYSESNADDCGTYKVYMGGTSGTVYVGSFTIGGEEITLGNVNGDKYIDSSDATCVLYYDAGGTDSNIGNVGKTITVSDASNVNVGTYASGDTLEVGNVNGDKYIDSSDATCILYYDAGGTDSNIGNVGITITGSIAE